MPAPGAGPPSPDETEPMSERAPVLPALLFVATLAGCGGGGGAAAAGAGTPGTRLPPPTDLAGVFILESSGVLPEDTVVAVPAGEGRTIIMRRGAPDNSLFAKVTIPAAGLTPPPGRDSTHVAVRPRPGVYGVTLETDGQLAAGATVTFSYGFHFAASEGARKRYGSDLAFEQVLLIGRVDPDGRVVFLPSQRPGSDLLEAVVPGPGAYVVAAPR